MRCSHARAAAKRRAHIRYLPIREEDGSPPPMRRVVLAWRQFHAV